MVSWISSGVNPFWFYVQFVIIVHLKHCLTALHTTECPIVAVKVAIGLKSDS